MSGGRKVRANVFAGNQWFHPGDTVPADVAKEITNPKAWDADEAEVDLAEEPVKVPGAGAVSGPLGDGGTPDETWKVKDLETYAADHGVDLDGATRKGDILARIHGGS